MSERPVIIGLAGYAQVGKDTVADHLATTHGYIHRSFAWNLRRLAWEVNPLLPHNGGTRWRKAHLEYGYERAKAEVDGYRQFLKDLGNGAREVLGEQVWVESALRDVKEASVVSDVRFLNEADAIKREGMRRGGKGVVVRIARPGYKAESSFEAEVPFIDADYIIENDGTVADLQAKVDRLMAQLSEGNPWHQMRMF